MVCRRRCCTARPLWGKNPTVLVGLLLEFFGQPPPAPFSHLRFHFGFQFAQRPPARRFVFHQGP
jgi:hypothetical protein